MSRMPSAKSLVGRKIVSFEPNPFPDGRGGTAHAPVLFLDDGTILRFVVKETDVGDYGIRIVASLAKRKG
jgi:hypothetical protein